MVVVPGAMPVANADAEPMVAIPVVDELHVPPGVALLSVVEEATHIADAPVIGVVAGFTVMVSVAKQPVESVLVMIAVPTATPVTIPVLALTVAKDTSLLVHVPLAV